MIVEVKVLGQTLKGVKSIEWKDKDTWVEIEIPFGDIKYQQIKGAQSTIKLECYDWDTLYTLFFNTNIGNGNYIVNPTTWKKSVFSTDGTQFTVQVRTLSGTYTFKFYDVRVRSINPSEIETSDDEITYTIEMTCKRVERVLA